MVAVPHAASVTLTHNDTCAEAAAVPPSGGVFHGSLGGYGVDFPSGLPASDHAADGVFRVDVAVPSRLLVRTTSPPPTIVRIAVRRGETCPGAKSSRSLSPQDRDGGNWGVAFESVVPAGVYWLFAFDGGTAGPYDLDIAILPE